MGYFGRAAGWAAGGMVIVATTTAVRRQTRLFVNMSVLQWYGIAAVRYLSISTSYQHKRTVYITAALTLHKVSFTMISSLQGPEI